MICDNTARLTLTDSEQGRAANLAPISARQRSRLILPYTAPCIAAGLAVGFLASYINVPVRFRAVTVPHT
ncbi:hypothetical protein J6590_027639 [Homalodisca vitripennis]|nr:hypothetical protein J6590_027639 [Homalodisca vitripennis]